MTSDTIIVDNVERRFLSSDLDAFLRWWNNIVNNINVPTLPHIPDFKCTVLDTIVGKRFFRTARGYIGFGPLETQEGDEIHVLLGAPVPYVFRRYPTSPINTSASAPSPSLEGSEDCYSYIGYCYLHGMMDGEALTNSFCQQRTILIR
jgi:hypothetical protein